MSYQEIAKSMIDKMPDDIIVFLINIMVNIGEMSGIDMYPEYEPNAETLATFAEGREMQANVIVQRFTNTKDLFASMEE